MKDRFRLFFILLYKDSNSYNYKDSLRDLKSFNNWAYIEHDPESEEKKYHVHFLLKLDNAMTKEALSKKTGIPVQFIDNVRNERSVVRYLVHADDEDKIQYEVDNIICSVSYRRYVQKCFNDKESEEVIINNIFNMVDKLVSQGMTYRDMLPLFISYINSQAYDTIYKRYRFEIDNYIKLSL